MNMNNKGFTLVELLAVLVILSTIMWIAIPSISSSMERAKKKQNNVNTKVLIAAAEMYVADHRYAIMKQDGSSCFVDVSSLLEGNYISDDVAVDADGNNINGVIVYTKSNNSYEYKDGYSGINACG